VAATGTQSAGAAAAATASAQSDVATGDQGAGLLRPLQDDAALGLVRGQLDGLVQQRLVGHHPVGLDAAGAGHHDLRLGIVDARGQLRAAKPPNTTEWMAPMRAQASMAMAASGTIGM
jgi:hypothetical protein